MIRLPSAITACLFDMDGVLTDTASVHAAAWKEMFDAYLDDPAHPFTQDDYDTYVDGKPRADGVRDFLRSRGIELSEDQVVELGDRKNTLVLERIHEHGVDPYPGSVRLLHAVRDAGLRTAVVSSSTNCREVVEAAGLADLLERRVDGHTLERQGLRGKPAPDSYLEAARELGVEPTAAAVFEDALAGVAAGHAGGFGAVVGVDRVGQAAALREHGATVVVTDLGELLG